VEDETRLVPIPAQDVYDPAELVQEIASNRSGKPVLPPLNWVFVFLMYLLLQYRLTKVTISDIYISQNNSIQKIIQAHTKTKKNGRLQSRASICTCGEGRGPKLGAMGELQSSCANLLLDW